MVVMERDVCRGDLRFLLDMDMVVIECEDRVNVRDEKTRLSLGMGKRDWVSGMNVELFATSVSLSVCVCVLLHPLLFAASTTLDCRLDATCAPFRVLLEKMGEVRRIII